MLYTVNCKIVLEKKKSGLSLNTMLLMIDYPLTSKPVVMSKTEEVGLIFKSWTLDCTHGLIVRSLPFLMHSQHILIYLLTIQKELPSCI